MGQDLQLKRALAAPLISYWREKALQTIEIDASARPFDMRPAAHAISNRIESLRALYPDQPLIVPMGERHTEPTTQFCQQAVMQECLNRGLIPAYALELDYRSLEQYAAKFGLSLSAQDIKRHQQADPHNILLRQMAYMLNTQPSHFQHLSFCHDHNVPISFNDAAVKAYDAEHDILDYGDAATRKVAEKLGYPTNLEMAEAQFARGELNDDGFVFMQTQGHLCVSQTGFHIRNKFMADKTLEQWHRQKPDVLFLATGSAHVFGAYSSAAGFHSPYEQGLTHYFRQHSKAVLPFGFGWSAILIPNEADLTNAALLRRPHESGDDMSPAALKRIEDASEGLVTIYPQLDDVQEQQAYAILYGMLKSRGFLEAKPS